MHAADVRRTHYMQPNHFDWLTFLRKSRAAVRIVLAAVQTSVLPTRMPSAA